jgi:hypothetical protein
MTLQPSPETSSARAATVVAYYLALYRDPAEPDPAVRGLAAARRPGELTQSHAGRAMLRSTDGPVDAFVAEQVLTELFGDVMVLADTRGGNTNGLWERLWASYRSFTPIQPADGELATMDPEAVSELCARLLADILLCADRLRLNSEDVSTNGHLHYLDTFGES